ncbi:hypothetical protein ACI784_17595 [Geodermatophilus sp. SYSU D01186]
MPVGVVVAVVVLGASVLLALAPIRRPRAVAVGGFLVVVLGVSELPQLFAVLLLTTTVPAVAQDGLLRTPPGWLLFGLALLTWAGLAVVARRASGPGKWSLAPSPRGWGRSFGDRGQAWGDGSSRWWCRSPSARGRWHGSRT